jgi:hypothetical protein
MLRFSKHQPFLLAVLGLAAGCGALLLGRASTADSPSHPKEPAASGSLLLTPAKQHLGKLLQHETKGFAFALKNIGKEPVRILNVEHTCGCTQAGADKDVLQPGEEGAITGSLNAQDRLGEFGSFLTVTFQPGQAPPEQLKVAIGARAVAFADMPGQVDLGSSVRGEPPKATTFEIKRGEAGLAWNELGATGKEVQASVRKIDADTWQITLAPPEQAPVGLGRETLAVTLLDSGRPVKTLEVGLLWKTASRHFSIIPTGVYLSGSNAVKVRIKSLTSGNVKVARIETPLDAPVQVKETEENGDPCLEFSNREAAPPPKAWSGKIKILLQDGPLEELCGLTVIQMAPTAPASKPGA